MPGGILDNLGNFFGGIAGSMNPALQENQFKQQAYQALARQNGPDDASILMGNPQAYGMGFQRQLFMDQLRSLVGPDPNNPRMSLNEALYHLSNEGQKQQYGITPVPGFKTPSGAEAPGTIVGGQLTPPPGMGFGGPTGTAGTQAQPSQQPAQLSPVDRNGIAYQAAVAAAKKNAETVAAAQPDLPILQTRSQQLITKLQAIRDNPELANVVGGTLGIKGRAGPLGQGQSDLVNDIQDANNALQGDLFTSLRATSGRGVSPGALKEMRITDLQAGRTGTLQGYKDNINKTIKQIQDEYGAAWQSRGAPDTYKPAWAPSAAVAPKIAPPAPAIAALKSQPQLRADFDKKYGDGAAMSVLGR